MVFPVTPPTSSPRFSSRSRSDFFGFLNRWRRRRRGRFGMEDSSRPWRGFLAYLFLSMVLTWPSPLHLGETIPGSTQGDAVPSLWTLWWMGASDTIKAAPFLRSPLLRAPEGTVVVPESLPLILLSPLGVPLLGAPALYTLGIWLSLAAIGWAARHLLLRLGISPPVAWMWGAVLVLSPSLRWMVESGDLGGLSLYFVPPTLLAFLSLLRSEAPSPPLSSGILLGVLAACDLRLGILALLALPFLGLSLLGTGVFRKKREFLVILLLALAFASLPLALNRTLSPGEGAASSWISDEPMSRLDLGRLLLPSLLLPSRALEPEHGAYLGLSLALLAALGLKRASREAVALAGAALPALVMGAGSSLVFGGAMLRIGSEPLWLPKSLLDFLPGGLLPSFANTSLAFGTLCLLPAAASGLAAGPDRIRLRRLLPFLGPWVVAADLSLSGSSPLPLPLRSLPDYRCLKETPAGPVAELPWVLHRRPDARDQVLLLQMGHGQPSSADPFHGGALPEGTRRWREAPSTRKVVETLEGLREEAPQAAVLALGEDLTQEGIRSVILPGAATPQEGETRGLLRCHDVAVIDLAVAAPAPVEVEEKP